MRERDAIAHLREIAADQAGFVTTSQASRLGVPARMLDQLARRGLLRRARHGVYVFETGPLHAQEELVSAWLAVDPAAFPWERSARSPAAVVSHASAAALRGLGTIIPRLPDLTQASQRSRRDEVNFHVARFVPEDWQWLDLAGVRLPVTTPARTIIDLVIDHEDGDYLTRAARQAFPSREVALAALVAAAERRKTRHGRLRALAVRLADDAFPEAA